MATKKATSKSAAGMKPVLVISGDEDLLVRRAVRKTIERQMKTGWKIDYADGAKPGSLESAMTPDIFSAEGTNRLFVVVTKPEKVDVELLKAHADRTEDDVVLLLVVDGKPSKATKFGKFVESLGEKNHQVFESPTSWKATEYAIEFCMKEAKLHGLELSENLAALIVDTAGTSLGLLAFEIMKISTLAKIDKVNEITRDHARGGIAALAETPVTAVLDALKERNRAKLMQALRRVRKSSSGDPTMQVTRMVGSSILPWLAAADLLTKGVTNKEITDQMLASELVKSPWLVENMIIPTARRWGVMNLDRLVKGLAESERAVLNGAVSPWTLLSVRLLEACG